MNHDEAPMDFYEEDEETQLISRCHHEAAHAVFAYHAGLEIFSVVAEEEGGRCDINLPEYREYSSPGELACFCLAGAYAAVLATTLFYHPDSEDVSLEWLREEADKTPEGDAYWALVYMERMTSYGDPSDDINEVHASVLKTLAESVEDRWLEIEAVAFALMRRGRLDGQEVVEIIRASAAGVTRRSSGAKRKRLLRRGTRPHLGADRSR